MKRHSSTFICARTRLWLSMQHEKRRERLHLGQSSQATHLAMTLAHPAPYGCSRRPLSIYTRLLAAHMLTNVTRVQRSHGSTPRLAGLARSRTNSHSESVQNELASAKTPTSQRTTRRATVEEDRTTQAPSQMHLPTSNHVPHPKPQRQHTPLACPHRVLLRITLDQTDRRTGPERPDIAPTPSRRKQPRHCP